MDALHLLQNRVSITKLVAPAPNAVQLLEVFKAANRAPDHGKLKPWRFLVIEGSGLDSLSNVLVDALVAANPDVSATVLEKTRNMPFRAPMIIVAIARCSEHPKVPKQEQMLASAAATQNLLNALFVMGFGAVWRTGELAYNERVKSALGLNREEEIVGFVYVGSPQGEIPAPSHEDVKAIFTNWLPK